jgi:hypothetical protein
MWWVERESFSRCCFLEWGGEWRECEGPRAEEVVRHRSSLGGERFRWLFATNFQLLVCVLWTPGCICTPIHISGQNFGPMGHHDLKQNSSHKFAVILLERSMEQFTIHGTWALVLHVDLLFEQDFLLGLNFVAAKGKQVRYRKKACFQGSPSIWGL